MDAYKCSIESIYCEYLYLKVCEIYLNFKTII